MGTVAHSGPTTGTTNYENCCLVLCAFLRDCLDKHVRDRGICSFAAGVVELARYAHSNRRSTLIRCSLRIFDLYSLSFVPAIPSARTAPSGVGVFKVDRLLVFKNRGLV